MKKLKEYKIYWKQINYGASTIKATSKKEAEKLALEGKDEGFEDYLDVYGTSPDWNIRDIERID
jgi:hypothetical protein